MNKSVALIIAIIWISCNNKAEPPVKTKSETTDEVKNDKIKVLNFATFHMGATSDAKTVEFDEENEQNQRDAQQIAQIISQFKPTVICVESEPKDDDELNAEYQKYLNAPEKPSSYYGEIGLVAFEIGRLNRIKRIYGIDHKLDYNYNIGNDIINSVDSTSFNALRNDPFAIIPDHNIFEEGISLMEKLRRMNHPKFLDFLILFNADMLALVGTKDGFEGADEAANYYKRNLRIYTNLNRIPLTKNDRVFILSGGSHTAFLNEFMNRSAKYEVVNSLEYLK